MKKYAVAFVGIYDGDMQIEIIEADSSLNAMKQGYLNYLKSTNPNDPQVVTETEEWLSKYNEDIDLFDAFINTDQVIGCKEIE